MNIINLRKGLRRSSETRRINDRRNVPYQFGSPQWLEHVQKTYAAWPKSERRGNSRRSDDRRLPDRRQHQLSEQRMTHRKFSKVLLSREELKLIEDLYLGEVD
jgi:hypothetical protein